MPRACAACYGRNGWICCASIEPKTAAEGAGAHKGRPYACREAGAHEGRPYRNLGGPVTPPSAWATGMFEEIVDATDEWIRVYSVSITR